VKNGLGEDAMSKPYWSGPATLKGSDDNDRRNGRRGGYGDDPEPRWNSGYRTGVTDSHGGYYPEEDVEDYDEYDSYDYEQHDTKWRWVAICAAIVLLVAVAATAVLMYGSDSSTKSAIQPQPGWSELTPSTAPRTVIATVPPTTPSATAPLPSETVVTVTTTPAETAPPSPPDTPVAPAPAANTVTYTVTGSRQLLDLVTIIYTNEQGFPQTDFNVALPWSKTVVLNPGVETKSVTATSLMGHLNCAITDSAGATLAIQTNNSMIATCTP
jgi:hypothetical protein